MKKVGRNGGHAAAFLLALLLLWQQRAFICPVQALDRSGEAGQIEASSEAAQPTLGTELKPGDHVLLGAEAPGGAETPGGAFGGYDFTVLSSSVTTGTGLLLCTNPLGLEQMPQQFDEAAEGEAGGHPDENSQLNGWSLWTESDLYIALNGSTKSGKSDTHEAEVGAAARFFERVSAKEDEWKALVPCTTDGSDGERISLLSELEFERYRTEQGDAFWYTNDEASGFWLKSARTGYTHQVRYIYSGDIPPSFSADAYYALARETRSVRPAVRIGLNKIAFGAGSGTQEDPYRELFLRPSVTLTLRVSGWNPQSPAEAVLTGPAVSGSAAAVTSAGIGPCTQVLTIGGIEVEEPFSLEIRKPLHIPSGELELRLSEDTELTAALACGDVNGDGSIDFTDRQLLLSAVRFAKGSAADLDGDGRTDLSDLCILMLNQNFGKRVRSQ